MSSATPHQKGLNHTFCLLSKSEAVGRICNGARRGQILYYCYPGLRGSTVVLTLQDIPKGNFIKQNAVIEQDINPCDIPYDAVFSKEEAIGRCSNGILKGQAIIHEKESHDELILGGVQPGPTSSVAISHQVYALRRIAAGTIIGSKDIRHEEVQTLARLSKFQQQQQEELSCLHPEGKKARYPVSKGQIITRNDIE